MEGDTGMGRCDLILTVVQQIYDAVLTPDGLANAMPSIAAAARGHRAVLMAEDGEGRERAIFASGIDVAILGRFDVATRDGLPGWIQAVPTGEPRRQSAMVSDRDFERSTLYNEAVRPTDGFYSIMTPLLRTRRQQVHLAVGRLIGAEDFDDEDVAVMRILAPHITTAWRLQQRLEGDKLRASSAHSVLNCLNTGVILVDYATRPVFVNACAEAIIASRDGLILTAAGPAAALPAQTNALRRAIGAAIGLGAPSASGEGNIGSGATTRLCLARPSLRPPLVVTVIPIRTLETTVWAERGAFAAIFVIQPEAAPKFDMDVIAGAFGLTRREAELAVLLAGGADLSQAAATLNIAVATVRWYLKRVLEKTDTHRQAELVGLLLHGFADRNV